MVSINFNLEPIFDTAPAVSQMNLTANVVEIYSK